MRRHLLAHLRLDGVNVTRRELRGVGVRREHMVEGRAPEEHGR